MLTIGQNTLQGEERKTFFFFFFSFRFWFFLFSYMWCRLFVRASIRLEERLKMKTPILFPLFPLFPHSLFLTHTDTLWLLFLSLNLCSFFYYYYLNSFLNSIVFSLHSKFSFEMFVLLVYSLLLISHKRTTLSFSLLLIRSLNIEQFHVTQILLRTQWQFQSNNNKQITIRWQCSGFGVLRVRLELSINLNVRAPRLCCWWWWWWWCTLLP